MHINKILYLQWFICICIKIRFLNVHSTLQKIPFFLINDVLITFKYMSIHIEQPKGDCLYNSYKDGDVCRGTLILSNCLVNDFM